VQRYDAKEHKKIPVTCSAAVKAYNDNMGGKEKNDQMTKLRRCRRHYRWPCRLVMKFFLWAAYNAYVLQHCFCPHKQPGKRLKTFHMFVDELCHNLVGTFHHSPKITSRRVSDPSDTRLLNDPSVPVHMPERGAGATSNNRCVVCNETYKQAKRKKPDASNSQLLKCSKTVYKCTMCQVYLCIGSGADNCFNAYHSKKQYWR